MSDWPHEHPSWLPIVMPRPELFSTPDHWPDLARIEVPHILELSRESRESLKVDALRRLISLEPPRCTPTPLDWSKEAWAEIDRQAHHHLLKSAFISLPIFTEVYLFARGMLNQGWHLAGEMGEPSLSLSAQDDFLGIITRSFITWSTRGLLRAPLYRTDRMAWCNYLPKPDFTAWPEGVPAQVIVPFERPHYSAHARMELRGEIETDLRFLSLANGWGTPLRPVWIDMPNSMEEVMQ